MTAPFTGRDVPCPACKVRAGRPCMDTRATTRKPVPIQRHHRARNERARAKFLASILDVEQCPNNRHNYTAYQHGECRCKVGRAAADRYRRALKHAQKTTGPQRISSVGSGRRVRALQRHGVSLVEQAQVSGLSRQTLRDTYLRPHVYRGTADIVAVMYDRLSVLPPVDNKGARIARFRQQPGPECWTPETIDDPEAQPQCADYDPDEVDIDLLVERIRAGRLDSRTLGNKDRKRVASRLVTEQSFTATSRMLHMNHTRIAQIAEAS